MNVIIKTYDNEETRKKWVGFVQAGPFTLFFPADGGHPVLHNSRAIDTDKDGRAYATCKPSEWPEFSRNIRKAAGITQAEISDILGFKSPATVSMYESGKRKATVADIEYIAAALGYSAEIVLTEHTQS